MKNLSDIIKEVLVHQHATKDTVKCNAIEDEYNEIKKKFPDKIILFKKGDFYEVYMDDAKECSKILGITLSKNNGVLISKFPYHALDKYLPKLIRAGKKVAINE